MYRPCDLDYITWYVYFLCENYTSIQLKKQKVVQKALAQSGP